MFAFKKFYMSESGELSTLFVNNSETLPVGQWIEAREPFHFTASNGKEYVPTRKSSNGGKQTGRMIKIPNEEVKQYLIENGYCTSKAKSIKCVAFRAGWHSATLPYFPQGGIKDKATAYGHKNEKNAVYCIIEIQGQDYTSKARSQSKCFSKSGKFIARNADLQHMPENGFYFYSTNPKNKDHDAWIISDKIKIVSILSRDECADIMATAGMPAQQWAE